MDLEYITNRIKNLSDADLIKEGIKNISDYDEEVQTIYKEELKHRNLNKNSVPRKSIDNDLRKILTDNDLQSYIEILEREKIFSINDLSELTQDDYKELGITALGDRKRFVKLFAKDSDNLPELQNNQTVESQPVSNNNSQQNDPNKPDAIIINNNTGSGGNAAHTGIAGVIGGILGAVAVIVIGLIILSNESFQL